MPIAFFGPKPNGQGGACNFVVQSPKQKIFVTFFKQTGWDAEKSHGSFKGGEKINLALSATEAGGLIYAVRTRGKYSGYHSYGDKTTRFSFSYYKIEPKTPTDKVREGFGFRVEQGDLTITVGLGVDAAMMLEQYLIFALQRIFNAVHAEDKKAFLERENASNPKSEGTTIETPIPEDGSTEVTDW